MCDGGDWAIPVQYPSPAFAASCTSSHQEDGEAKEWRLVLHLPRGVGSVWTGPVPPLRALFLLVYRGGGFITGGPQCVNTAHDNSLYTTSFAVYALGVAWVDNVVDTARGQSTVVNMCCGDDSIGDCSSDEEEEDMWSVLAEFLGELLGFCVVTLFVCILPIVTLFDSWVNFRFDLRLASAAALAVTAFDIMDIILETFDLSVLACR